MEALQSPLKAQQTIRKGQEDHTGSWREADHLMVDHDGIAVTRDIPETKIFFTKK